MVVSQSLLSDIANHRFVQHEEEQEDYLQTWLHSREVHTERQITTQIDAQ